MHEDDEKCYSSDKRDADEVQADSQPTHGTAEEVVGSLIGVQQFLISDREQFHRGQTQFFDQSFI